MCLICKFKKHNFNFNYSVKNHNFADKLLLKIIIMKEKISAILILFFFFMDDIVRKENKYYLTVGDLANIFQLSVL